MSFKYTKPLIIREPPPSATPAECEVLQEHTDCVVNAVFSHDGQRLATGQAGSFHVFDTHSWRRKSSLQWTDNRSRRWAPYPLVFSPDDQMVMVALCHDLVKVYNLGTNQLVSSWEQTQYHTETAGAWAPNNRFIVTGSSLGTINIFNVRANFAHVHRVDGLVREDRGGPPVECVVTCVAVSPDSRFIASCVDRGRAFVHDAIAPRNYCKLIGHTERYPVHTVSFSPDSKFVVTTSYDGIVRLFRVPQQEFRFNNIPAEREVRSRDLYGGNTCYPRCAAFSPFGRFLAIGLSMSISPGCGGPAPVLIMDVDTLALAGIMGGHRGDIHAVDFHPSGKFLAAGSEDKTCRVWTLPKDLVDSSQPRTSRTRPQSLDLDAGIPCRQPQSFDLDAEVPRRPIQAVSRRSGDLLEFTSLERDFPERIKIASAEGGFGELWKSTLRVGNVTVPVAIKVPRLDMVPLGAKREAMLKSFKIELKQLSGLHHEHVLGLFGGCYSTQQPFLVVELMRHGDLAKKIVAMGPLVEIAGYQRRQSLAMRLAICRQFISGLQFLHSRGIIHRDVKPQNVLIAQDSGTNVTVKICDFGLAQTKTGFRTTASMTAMPAGIMTVMYAAPEAFEDNHEPDFEFDKWAAGLVMLEVLAGRFAWEGIGMPQFYRMMMNKQAPTFTAGELDILPPNVVSAVNQLLRGNPSERMDFRDVLGILE